jgi:hypothetical protein
MLRAVTLNRSAMSRPCLMYLSKHRFYPNINQFVFITYRQRTDYDMTPCSLVVPAFRRNILLPSSGLFLLTHSKRLYRGTASSTLSLLHLLRACSYYFFWTWRKRQYFHPKRRWISTRLQCHRLDGWTWHLEGSRTVVNWCSYLFKKWTNLAY